MKIERLRKSHKKEIIIGIVLTVVIGGVLTFRLTHSKYRYTESIDLAEGVIHYKTPDFQIMAIKVSDDGTNYSDSDVIPTGNYVINEEKTYCKVGSGEEVKGKIKTVNGIHGLYNIKKGDKCYLYFDVKNTITIGDNEVEYKTTTPDFSSIATTDEGVYSAADGMYNGTTYYWRGAATTNHVIFASMCWRIVRINGDGTMRLIYNGGVLTGNTCTENGANSNAVIMGSSKAERHYSTSDGKDDNPSYVGWTYNLGSQRPTNTASGTASNAKTQTEKWYTSNLASYANKISNGKFCNDRNIGNGSWTTSTDYGFEYAPYRRLFTNKTPTFSCPSNDVYTLKVGAITADEVAFAGGVDGKNNSSYYMYTGQNYWTMSPLNWVDFGWTCVFSVFSTGCLDGWSVAYDDEIIGLRPVINLRSDVNISSGNGTCDLPYIVQ